MEYRVRYRDIPWGVALFVLPGKICGTFMLRPYLWFMKHWKRRVVKILWFLAAVAAVICFCLLIQQLTDGVFFEGVVRMANDLMNIFESEPEVLPKEL